MATRQVGSQLPSWGSNPRPRHWKVKSQPLDHQGSPSGILLGQRTVIHGLGLALTPTGGLRSVSSCPSPTPDCPLSPRSVLPVPKTCSATSNHYYYFLAVPCSLGDLGPRPRIEPEATCLQEMEAQSSKDHQDIAMLLPVLKTAPPCLGPTLASSCSP